MAKRAPASLHEQNRKVIVDTIRNLGGGKYRRYQVFSDWVEMLALALSNAVDKSQFDVREARYLEIAKRYAKEELTEIAGLLPRLVDEFSQGQDGISFDDVLGDIFMACEFGSDSHGQYFTPYHISSLMAQMVAGTQGQDALQRRGFVRANEPTCGAGGMCVALAETMHKADTKHVAHALRFLKPDGLLVSVMSASVTFRDNKLTADFRALIRERGGDIEALPEGSFKSSGTGVNTVIVTIPAGGVQ